MIIVDLPQGSEEWHKYRLFGIGSSDSASIMNLNKYQTIQDLYLKKTGQIPPHQEDSEATAHGIKNEDLVRQMINIETGSNYIPACIISSEYDFIRASLDGMNEDSTLEIKCPFNKHSYINQRKKIPDYYYTQVQHQLLTTGYEIAYFTVWFEYKKFTYKILRNEKFIHELKNRIINFWECVETNTPPNYEEYKKYEY